MAERDALGLARAAAWVAIAVSVPIVVFLIGSNALIAVPEARIAVHVLLVIAGAAWVLASARGAAMPSLVIWLLPLMVVLGVSTITSVRPGPSREALALCTLVALTYPVVFTAWSDPQLRRRIEWLLIAMAGFLASAYLAIAIVLWILWWGAAGLGVPPLRPGNLELTLGSPNAVAFHLESLTPLAAALAWRRWHHLSVSLLLLAGGTAALIVTGSRGGWIGAAAGAAAMVLVTQPWRHGTRIGALVRSRKPAVALIACLAIVGIGIGAPRLVLDDAGRIELWRATVAIFEAHPILGAGPGTWAYLRPGQPIADANTAVLYTPHDIVLQMGAELGLLGLVAGGILAFGIVRIIVRAARRTEGADLVVVAAATAAVVAIAVHSLVDSLFFVPGFMLLVFLNLVVLDEAAGGLPGLAQSRRGRLIVVAISSVVMAATLSWLIPIDAALLHARQGDRALASGDSDAALSAYQQAVDLDDQSQYQLGRAIALDHLGRRHEATAAFKTVSDTEMLAFQRAILARRAMADGDTGVARDLAHDVIEMGAYDPTALLNAAVVLDASGENDVAVDALAVVIRAVPSLAGIDDVPDIGAETWVMARERAIDQASAGDPLAAADLAIWAGALARARALVEDAPPSTERVVLGAYIDALRGGSVDWGAVREAVRSGPNSGRLLDWYVRLARLAGYEADERDGRIMLAVGLAGGPTSAWTIRRDGPTDAATALRIPHYPVALTARLGPLRPYPDGMLTIEPLTEP